MIFSSTLVGFWWQLGVHIGSKMHQVGDIWRACSCICCQWCSPWLPDLPATSPTPLKISSFKNFSERTQVLINFRRFGKRFLKDFLLSCTSSIQHDTRKINGDIFNSFPKPSQESTVLEFRHILQKEGAGCDSPKASSNII